MKTHFAREQSYLFDVLATEWRVLSGSIGVLARPKNRNGLPRGDAGSSSERGVDDALIASLPYFRIDYGLFAGD